MIRFERLTLSRGGRTLLEQAEAAIGPGERLALIGRNGTGKTTLLAALAGEVLPDSGNIVQPWKKVMRLGQSLPTSSLPGWRYLLDSDAELTGAQAQLEAAPASDGMAIAEAHERWIDAGGATAQARARTLLAGLGFDSGRAEAPVDTLSGGWRMRLNLARALFAPSDLLLLDEPTNHLDLDAILWLERWLLRYPGTLLFVSHDRDFVDRIAQTVLHFEQTKLIRYAGGYSAFEQQQAQRRTQLTREHDSQRQRVGQLETFIERFRAKASKARQVQSRIKALERMVRVLPAREPDEVEFSLYETDRCADPMLRAEALDAGYGPDDIIVREAELTIRRGARIGVLGRNGAGKTTLIRTLTGELPPLGGRLHVAASVRTGYFAQQGIDRLDDECSPLEHLRRLAPDARDQDLRDELGRFGFSGENAMRPTGPMSGGEKARLLLALMLHDRPQLLILDEPTNHLDAPTRDALAAALADFDGALLLVSHDRYLLRTTVDDFVLIADGRMDVFDGDLEDYASRLARSPLHRTSPDDASALSTNDGGRGATGRDAIVRAVGAPGNLSRRDERRNAASRRALLTRRLLPLEQEIERIELRLAAIGARIGSIDIQLGAPEAWNNPDRANTLTRERVLLQREQDGLEESWLEASTARDAERATFEHQEPGVHEPLAVFRQR